MQILTSHREPECPTCRRKLHRHGHYVRTAKGTRTPIQRWFCPRCCRTVSVLPGGLLPYCNLSCAELQAAFDAWGFEDQMPTSRAAVRALGRFLQPALQNDLRHGCGQLLEAALDGGQALWRGLRRSFCSAERLVHWLNAYLGRSLLGRYACQRKDAWTARTHQASSSSGLRNAIPQTL